MSPRPLVLCTKQFSASHKFYPKERIKNEKTAPVHNNGGNYDIIIDSNICNCLYR